MPLLLGPLVAIALGAIFAWLGRAEAPREDEHAFRARAAVVLAFAALVYAPACAYFPLFAGDWALFYLLDHRDVPSAIELVVIVADAALVVGGFAAGHLAAKRRAPRSIVALAAAPLALSLAAAAALLSRLRIDGTYHQVTSRFGTQPAAGSPLGWAILWMDAMIVAGAVITARALLERPRPPKPRASDAPAEKQPLLGRRRARRDDAW